MTDPWVLHQHLRGHGHPQRRHVRVRVCGERGLLRHLGLQRDRLCQQLPARPVRSTHIRRHQLVSTGRSWRVTGTSRLLTYMCIALQQCPGRLDHWRFGTRWGYHSHTVTEPSCEYVGAGYLQSNGGGHCGCCGAVVAARPHIRGLDVRHLRDCGCPRDDARVRLLRQLVAVDARRIRVAPHTTQHCMAKPSGRCVPEVSHLPTRASACH